MSLHGRQKGELTLGGDGAQCQGGYMSLHGRPKGEFPPGWTARSAKGAT